MSGAADGASAAAGTAQTQTQTQTALGAGAAAASNDVPEWLGKEAAPEIAAWVKTKAYPNAYEVAKAAFNSEKLIGNNIAPPKDGKWSPEALKALGVPEKPEGYQIERPQMPEGVPYDEAFEKAMLPVVHAAGLPPSVVNQLIQAVTAHRLAEHQNIALANETAMKEGETALKTEWGNAYPDKLRQAGRAALALGGSEFIAHLNAKGLGNDPIVLKTFAKLGDMMGEDVLKSGVSAGSGITPADAKAEIAKLQTDEAYLKREHPGHADAVKKMEALYAAAYPDQQAA